MISLPCEVGIKVLDLSDEVEHFYLFTIEADILCRPLTIGETETLRRFSTILPDYILEEWICRKSVVYCSKGDEWLHTEAKAGYVSCISAYLLSVSSIKDEVTFKKLVKEARSTIGTSLLSEIESIICTAYKQITPKEVRNMSISKYLGYLVKSENILNIKIFNDTPKRGGPRIKDGFTSIGDYAPSAEWLTSKEAADSPNFTEKIP